MKRLFKGEAYRPTGYGIIVLKSVLVVSLINVRYGYDLDLCSSRFKNFRSCDKLATQSVRYTQATLKFLKLDTQA
ncbi:MAG: hypothetical protein LBJ00_10095 [Planctomycetaceae bacterium]|nr:hypothetical protein [Planctomycetaceae bacterium]